MKVDDGQCLSVLKVAVKPVSGGKEGRQIATYVAKHAEQFQWPASNVTGSW